MLTIRLSLFAFVAATGPSTPPDPKGYVCHRAEGPVVIDGKLDESAWAAAPWSDPFVDIEGDKKPKPRWRTRMKMLWDERFLYIAAEMDEPQLWGTLTQHDAVIFHDPDFEVFLDPDGDNHVYGELELNALNTTWDLLLTKPYRDGGKAVNGWEIAGLKTAVHLEGTLNDPRDKDRGWTVEIAWPWAAIKELTSAPVPPRDADQWRINFSRVEWDVEVADGKYRKVKGRPEHNWVWSPQGVVDMHRPERWGYLQFSAAKAGTVAFRPDPDRTVRDQLHRVYDSQRDHHAKAGSYSNSRQALKLDPDAVSPSLRIASTRYSFDAELPSVVDPTSRWVISQDSWIRKVALPSKEVGLRWWDERVEQALANAAGNRSEIEAYLNRTPADQRKGAAFLVANMPEGDLRTLKAEFLLANSELAYKARREVPWGKEIPEDLFFNDVLPYANLDEQRDEWRKRFFELCLPIAKTCETPSEAAHRLNTEIFKKLNVQYSTQRKAPNQSPSQSIETGKASCTGLSIVLSDACRAVCIPARLVGTPLWANKRGNHTWVEIWDGRWRFTGACEPDPNGLDRGWFVADASQAVKDSPQHAIYASSFKKTGLHFPLVWARRNRDVPAENVTDRYTKKVEANPQTFRLMVRVVNAARKRVAVPITIQEVSDSAKSHVETSRGETADTNDFATFELEPNAEYSVKAEGVEKRVKTGPAGKQELVEILVGGSSNSKVDAKVSASALAALKEALASKTVKFAELAARDFAKVALTKADAKAARDLLWKAHVETIRAERAEEVTKRVIKDGKLEMPFFTKTFGAKPAGGRSLWISLHGGGGAPKRVNDRQWENQKRLYTVDEGIYLAPRGPTDNWNLWHEPHIDRMFGRLIEDLIVFEDVNPDRVYVLGYSAGGDGVYQIAPRMADRWAGAAMMAGHPNGVSLLSLRNVPFALQVGGDDSAYNRNKVGREYGETLAKLRKDDPKGYEQLVKIYEGKGHWMDRVDKAALPWLAKFTRNPVPERVVWKQTGVPHERSYWLAVPKDEAAVDSLVVAERIGQTIRIDAAEKVKTLLVRIDDRMLDLDQRVSIVHKERTLFTGLPPRTIGVLAKTLASRGDLNLMFDAEVSVVLQ
jgi:poly(3-hydroxybutyrate) depolymerase